MRLLLVSLLLIGVAAVLVQSETSFEVDDNGDEFEVKRFNIQSRQLNGGRSQCVVSRRRRSMPAAGGYGANEDEDQDEDERQEVERLQMIPATPPSGPDTFSSMGDPNQNGDEGQFLPVAGAQNVDESPSDSDEDGDDMEDEHDISGQQVLFQTVPAKSQTQSNVEGVAVAVDGAVASPNGVVVVQAESPPHVNPNTHAVFELLPVGAAADDDDDDYYDYYDYGDNDRSELFEEDLSPVSTLAIWSTGNDVSAGDDFGLGGGGNIRPKPTNQNNKVSYGNSGTKVGKKGKKKPPSRGGNRNRNRNKIGNNRHKVTKKRRRPSVNSNRNGVKGNRRPATVDTKTKKNKRQRHPNKKTHVRRKTNRNKSDNKKKNKKKNKLQKEHSVSNRNHNRRTNANLAKRKKNRNNKDSIDQGVHTYTKSETYTQTGSSNDNRDVNCIIIRKDPPPTTQRPFWNILGRDAGNVQTSGQFGKRKRANLRFVI